MIKRLTDALAEGDCIHAVIRGSAINNDGAAKVSYTAPSVDGQTATIAEALAMAQIEPETITYIEAHGTGTPLGDPIEVEALTRAFRDRTEATGFCGIGSVKTNIGHLDAAAGIAGLIKTVLALKHQMLPPSLHFEHPNPMIDFANSPFYVNAALREWPRGLAPRRAGVSSFGIGGTNAHVILKEAPMLPSSGSSRPWKLLVISAKTRSALEAQTDNIAKHLKSHPDVDLADVAFTLQVGRKAFSHRRMLVCANHNEAVAALEISDPRRLLTRDQPPKTRPVVFMFPGQGAQYVQMAEELYHIESIFRDQVDICADLLHPHLGLDLRGVLHPSQSDFGEATQRLQQTDLAQPALFMIEYALAKLWMAWGIHPEAMIGHSIGEYVAACLAGVFSLEEALALVAVRGRLMQQLPTGSMLAVPLAEQDIQPFLSQELSLAAVNGPALCVVSGPSGAVKHCADQLTAKGIACRPLHTSHAFHSAMMDSVIEPFATQVARVSLRPPQLPYISSLTGAWITSTEATDPQYWARHLRHTVRFAQGVETLLAEPSRILLEVGPGKTLNTLTQQQPTAGQVLL